MHCSNLDSIYPRLHAQLKYSIHRRHRTKHVSTNGLWRICKYKPFQSYHALEYHKLAKITNKQKKTRQLSYIVSPGMNDLIENVDITFVEYKNSSEIILDMAFHNKSFDGGEHNEIHTIITVEHNKNDITQPYIIKHWYKEYIWNMLISFDQEDVHLDNTIYKKLMKTD